MEHDTVSIRWTMDAGHPGEDRSPQNPFYRSVSNLIRTGKPFSRLAFSFLRESHSIHWFGAFVEGERTMFFPGFSASFDRLQAYYGTSERANRGFQFDHITLEADRRSWHMTAEQRSDYVGNPRTLDLGKGRVLWFGLSFPSISSFQPAMNSTIVEFTAPKGDGERRRKAVMDAREGAEFPLLSWNEDRPPPAEEFYNHVSFIAGPAGFEPYLGPEQAFPVGSPYLRDPFPSALEGIACRTVRLQLSSRTDIQLTLSRIPGALVSPVAFTSSTLPSATEHGGGTI